MNTRLDTVVLVAKALCYLGIGFFTPLTVGLAQWANSGEWPGRIIWVVIGASCCVGALNSLLSFLSGSYSAYTQKKSSSDTQFFTKQQPPTTSTTTKI